MKKIVGVYYLKGLALSVVLGAMLAGCSGDDGNDGSDGVDTAASTIELSFLGRYSAGVFDESAAEIVDFDPQTNTTFVVNANSGQVDLIDTSSPSTPNLSASLDVAGDVAGAVDGLAASDLGAANSVAVYGNTLAVAIEADTKQESRGQSNLIL